MTNSFELTQNYRMIYGLIAFSISLFASVTDAWSFTSGVRQVWHGDTLLTEDAKSYENREYRLPMNAQSSSFLSQRGHTDVLVAVAVMQLVDEGKLALDSDVLGYLDAGDFAAFGFPEGKSWCPAVRGEDVCLEVTVRQLLSMSAGLIDASGCDYSSDSWENQFCTPKAHVDTTEGSHLSSVISAFIRNPLAQRPGSSFKYAHENFLLLAYIVEKMSGLSLSNYLSVNVFHKLGMESTIFDSGTRQLSLFKQPSSYVEYYEAETRDGSPKLIAEGSCDELERRFSRRSVGNLVTTVPDLIRFYSSIFVAQNASHVLSISSKELMLERYATIPANHCWLVTGRNDVACFYGLGLKLVYTVGDTNSLLAFGTDSSRQEGCFSSAVVVYNDKTVPIHPVVAAGFSNSRAVFVEKSRWKAAMNGYSDCIACSNSVQSEAFTPFLAEQYSQPDNKVKTNDESHDLREQDPNVGLIVAVILVPVFVVTVLWLLVVTDYHRKKVLRTPIEQAERLRRVQLQMESQGLRLPETVQNPLAGHC